MRQITTNHFIALAFLCAPSKEAFSLFELERTQYRANRHLEPSDVRIDWRPGDIADATKAGPDYFRVVADKVHRATKCGRVSVCEALTPYDMTAEDLLWLINAVLMALCPMGSTLCRSCPQCVNEDGCVHSVDPQELRNTVRPVRWIARCESFCPKPGLEIK